MKGSAVRIRASASIESGFAGSPRATKRSEGARVGAPRSSRPSRVALADAHVGVHDSGSDCRALGWAFRAGALGAPPKTTARAAPIPMCVHDTNGAAKPPRTVHRAGCIPHTGEAVRGVPPRQSSAKFPTEGSQVEFQAVVRGGGCDCVSRSGCRRRKRSDCVRSAERRGRSCVRIRTFAQRESGDIERPCVPTSVVRRPGDAFHDGRPRVLGVSWTNTSFAGDKITGLDTFYSGVGGTSYARTNAEYYDLSGNVNTTGISKSANLKDSSATPSGAPSTSQVLAAVAKATSDNPVPNAYYPVYSDKPRGNAGYCAWHSTGTINGIRVQFGFFFNLDGDPGCDPKAPPASNTARASRRSRT